MQLYFGMNPLFQVSLLPLFLLPLNAGLWADTIYLLNGESLQGVFRGFENGYYKFQTQDGKTRCILREETHDLHVIQEPKGPLSPLEGDKTKDSIVCGESEKTPLEKPKEGEAPLQEGLPPEGKALQKEGLPPEGKPLQKEGLTPEGRPLQKEEALPKDELGPKEKPLPKEEPLPKKEALPKKELIPKEELSQKEKAPPKKRGKSFLDSFLDSMGNFFKPIGHAFRDFFRRYPLSGELSLALGNSQLIYYGPDSFGTVTYADFGESDISGDLDAEYPSSFDGPFLRLGLLAELSLQRLYKPLSLQMGIDYSHAVERKNDRPLRLSGIATIWATGETRSVESKTEYIFSYNYLSFFFGPSYKLPTVKIPYTDISLDNFYASAHLRLLLSGSYTLEKNSETTGSNAIRESSTITESINKSGLGFGLNFGKKFNWPKNYNTSLNFSYSYDKFDFAGVKYINSFYGFSLGLGF